MALALYEYDDKTNTFVAISAGTQANPITTVHKDGIAVVQKLYLRNGDNTKWYDAITITPNPQSLTGPGNVNSWTVKLLAGDKEPTASDWSNRTTGAALSSTNNLQGASPRTHFLPEIGDANAASLSYYPFWVQITIPKSARNQTEVGMTLDVDQRENAVVPPP